MRFFEYRPKYTFIKFVGKTFEVLLSRCNLQGITVVYLSYNFQNRYSFLNINF